MNILECIIIGNTEIANGIQHMELLAPEIASESRPGQFVNLYTPDGGTLLPRPISLCKTDKEKGIITLVFRVVGKGTEMFAHFAPGEKIKIMGPLGNGYPLDLPVLRGERAKVALIGGGMGIAPLLELARTLAERFSVSKNVTIYLGYSGSETFLLDEFKATGWDIRLAVMDGSVRNSYKGNVVDCLKNYLTVSEQSDYPNFVFACGPEPMLRLLYEFSLERGISEGVYISAEERMACGLGVCLGCAVKTSDDGNGFRYKKCCKDGPVFPACDIYPAKTAQGRSV